MMEEEMRTTKIDIDNNISTSPNIKEREEAEEQIFLEIALKHLQYAVIEPVNSTSPPPSATTTTITANTNKIHVEWNYNKWRGILEETMEAHFEISLRTNSNTTQYKDKHYLVQRITAMTGIQFKDNKYLQTENLLLALSPIATIDNTENNNNKNTITNKQHLTTSHNREEFIHHVILSSMHLNPTVKPFTVVPFVRIQKLKKEGKLQEAETMYLQVRIE